MEGSTHVCGACAVEYETEQEYLDHVCPATSHTPTEVAHQDVLTDGAFSIQAEAALERGAERSQE